VPIVCRDNTLRGEVYMVFALPHRCGFRIGYDIELRRSNVDLVGYTAQSAGVQFFAGWR
jgi:hypothetical protein